MNKEKQEKENVHCQDCGGTDSVQVICSGCLEKTVLRVCQEESINPVKMKTKRPETVSREGEVKQKDGTTLIYRADGAITKYDPKLEKNKSWKDWIYVLIGVGTMIAGLICGICLYRALFSVIFLGFGITVGGAAYVEKIRQKPYTMLRLGSWDSDNRTYAEKLKWHMEN